MSTYSRYTGFVSRNIRIASQAGFAATLTAVMLLNSGSTAPGQQTDSAPVPQASDQAVQQSQAVQLTQNSNPVNNPNSAARTPTFPSSVIAATMGVALPTTTMTMTGLLTLPQGYHGGNWNHGYGHGGYSYPHFHYPQHRYGYGYGYPYGRNYYPNYRYGGRPLYYGGYGGWGYGPRSGIRIGNFGVYW